MVVDVVFPAIAPGLIIQFPAGKLFNTTDPIDTAQVGCVMVPTVGGAGVGGCVFTVMFVTAEMHPLVFCAVSVCAPGDTAYPPAG